MRLFTHITRGQLSVHGGRESGPRGQSTPASVRRCGVVGSANGAKTVLLSLMLGVILVALSACAQVSGSDEDFVGAVYRAPLELPTMSEDVATAGVEVLAARLEQIGAMVEEIAATSAAASPVVATATPEPFRLAFSGNASDVAGGEISARGKQILRALASDLKIDMPSDPGLLMAALIPSVSDMDTRRESIPTLTPGRVAAVTVTDDGDVEEGDTAGPSVAAPGDLERKGPVAGDAFVTPSAPVSGDSTEDLYSDRSPVVDDGELAQTGVVEDDLSGPGRGSSAGVAHRGSPGPDTEDASGKSGASHGAAKADPDQDEPDDSDERDKENRSKRNAEVDEDNDKSGDSNRRDGTNRTNGNAEDNGDEDGWDGSGERGEKGRTKAIAESDNHRDLSGAPGDFGYIAETTGNSLANENGHSSGSKSRRVGS